MSLDECISIQMPERYDVSSTAVQNFYVECIYNITYLNYDLKRKKLTGLKGRREMMILIGTLQRTSNGRMRLESS